LVLFDIFFYSWPFLHVHNLQENLLFSTLILGSVFNDYVVFYGDMQLGYMLCNIGYVGRSCLLAATAAPVITHFRRGCTCDVRKFRCHQVFITATDIYNSGSLTCKLLSADSVSLRSNLCSAKVNSYTQLLYKILCSM